MVALRAIVVAGPNGAGKTSFARQFLPLLHPNTVFLNADEIQRTDPRFAPPVAASRELLKRITRAEQAKVDFAVETTLASRTYISRIRRWHGLGFRSTLHFIELPSPEFAVQRVRDRVASGGHDIPDADIRRRFRRGRELFFDVYQPMVHSWFHWFSDSSGLRLVDQSPRT